MEVQYHSLIVGEKYGIIHKKSHISYDIIGICISYNKTFSTFDILNKHKKYSSRYKTIFYMNSSFRYFLLNQKQKIQEAMENRALQKILQQIISDNTFIY
jgi:hypothetical protein